MGNHQRGTYRVLAVICICAALGLLWRIERERRHLPRTPLNLNASKVDKRQLAQALGAQLHGAQNLPSEAELQVAGRNTKARIEYTLDPESQSAMESLFEAYKPDYGAFVALDASNGRVISLVSWSRQDDGLGHLALRASFPSASIFKVVTAAAALDKGRATPETVIPFEGRNHTLYKRALERTQETRWTRYMTLREAFAKSVNTVFGKLGLFFVHPDELQEYADRFAFNREIASELPIGMGHARIDPNDRYSIAEAASGFNRENRMSPLQGALIAAAVANDGVMMEPYLVRGAWDESGESLYRPAPQAASVTMSPESARQLRAMMEETIDRGTARKGFRQLMRKRVAEGLELGAKTGSLTGDDPAGKCDWFVGYAKDGDRKLAIAALTVNKKYWTVKSSYLAARFVENYFTRDATPQASLQGGVEQRVR